MPGRSSRMPARLMTCGALTLVASLGWAAGQSGPAMPKDNPNRHETGDRSDGKPIFRMETFGNEGFWTDAARLPAGVVAAKFTPVDALKAGYNINIDAVPDAMKPVLAAELKTDLSPARAPKLNDVATTVALINANAVIGVVAKDSNGDGRIDVGAGDKVGVACAFCHAITDGSVFSLPKGGSIGKELDGPTPSLSVRLAAAMMLQPHLLTSLLPKDGRADWIRLVGQEAEPRTGNVIGFAARTNQDWGTAVSSHRGNGRLIQDAKAGTWATGAGLEIFDTTGWPDGRAGFVLQALAALDLDSSVSGLPEEVRGWIANAATA